jgi:two-component system, chemotaxis family, response regulator Rcp1
MYSTIHSVFSMHNTISRPVDILLVEDNPGDVRLTQEAFSDSRIPININVAMDGEEALAYLRRIPPYSDVTRPDMILLDLNIPKRDGREVLEEVKKDPFLHNIPVVVLTTSNAEQDIQKTYNLNVNAYINKPVDFDKFLDIVQKIEDFWLMTAILPTNIR